MYLLASFRFPLFFGACLAAVALPLHAQKKNDQLGLRTEEEILKTVKLPDGYEATVFARPPQGGYPIAVSAAIDGTIFVAIDENGSLGRDRNPAPGVEGPKDGRIPGKVVRMRDTDGDGHADEFKTFCEVESPRGVIWDGPSGTSPGTLYVMHPPNLTAYTDTDGDGVADKQEDILTGLGFGLDFRGADHTTNGCRLAIDGFIYIAMGDYGCVEAKAKDGTVLRHRGGGIVRIRPDGTGLELVVEGTRNILDVAVSPTLDIFTRDNTNDGGGWNDRLSFNPPGAHMGYPTLFVNFVEDHLQPLADYGGGSPCGSLWLDEPGLQNGLYTVEWGRSAIFYHPLKQKGAGWELVPSAKDADPKNPGAQEFIKLTRPTDMDVDASGRLYITSWEGATFNYNGPFAGYVLRVVKKDAPKVEIPDLGNAKGYALTQLLAGKSAVLRLAAQREILRRIRDAHEVSGLFLPLEDDLKDSISSSESQVAIFLTGAQLSFKLGFNVGAAGLPAFDHPNSRMHEFTFAVLGNGGEQVKGTDWRLEKGLSDQSARVRAAAIAAARRLKMSDAAPSILPLVADEDPVVAHLAVRALSALKASQVCLEALDSSDEKVKPGALKALYGIYEPAVVDGLIARLPGSKGELRSGILNALCRLDNQDAPYANPSEWWTTRPDTSGPVYKPERWAESDKIEAALKKESNAAKGEEARWLVQRMYLTKVNFPGLVEQILAACGNDTPARLTAVEGMFRSDHSLPPEAVAALASTAESEAETPEFRARALRLLQRGADHGSVFPTALSTFAPFAGYDLPHAALTAAFEDFSRDAKNGKWVGDYDKALHGKDAAKRQFAATVLVNLATGRVGGDRDREAAKKAVEKAFAQPEAAAALLTAIARTGARPYAEQVKANLNNPNNTVAEAALFAYQKLGLKDTGAPAQLIGTMKYEDVFAAVQKGGDAKAGQEMFLRAGCIACHTITAAEPPKGPILSAVAKIYDRAALTESILKPSAKIAQGFESQWFKTKKGEQIEGFVTREGGDSLDVRNIVGQNVTLEKGDIAERGKRDISIMPEGLLNAFTPAELSNLLAYLESLKAMK